MKLSPQLIRTTFTSRGLARPFVLLVHVNQRSITPQTSSFFTLPSSRSHLHRPSSSSSSSSSSTTTTTHHPTHSIHATMQISCQCTSISFPITGPLLDLYHCHCLECQKQSSSAFGTSAIFPSSSFTIPTEMQSKLSKWTRPTKEGRTMDCYFCRECGCRIYHHIREADGTLRGTVSVKGGVIEGLEWKGSKHIYTMSAVVEIPEGVERFEAAPGEMVGRRVESK
ncbi:hypothetical protein QC762_507180 [Podospora pseudocomata]|uniref:CENP-V/GFA domain-containing protein n=1 Tax=Podospora pseudocomata TaxID=2093779 RepID=A0ABR0GCB5_9PEZI|nr:hypothetical protein QC762_507180 [Podospora pseudocomata]